LPSAGRSSFGSEGGELTSAAEPPPDSALAPLFALIGFGVGFEALLSGQVYSYCIQHLRLSSAEAAAANSAFYFCFTAMRLLSVPLSAMLNVRALLAASFAVQTAGLLLLSLASASPWRACAGVGLCGAGVAAIYAGTLSLLADVTPLTGKLMGRMQVAASVGAMLCPASVAWASGPERMGHGVLLYVATLLAAGQIGGFAIVATK
jgi:MFS family permease